MKKILVADDEEHIVEILKERLSHLGYEVFTALDGMQAVDAARKNMPDLIILDIMMPAGGGVAAFEILKGSAETSKIPVIFLTAHVTGDVKKEVLEKGAFDYLMKPVKTTELIEKIKAAIGDSYLQ